MPETAESVIKDALVEILVQSVEQPIQPDEAQTAIRYLNRMMNQWEARGYALGYTEVTNLSDPITVPPAAIDGVVAMLAIKLAAQYDANVSPALMATAKQGMEAIQNITIDVGPAPYPSTLPRGSGNVNTKDGFLSNNFYYEETDDILPETQGVIVQESGDQ